MQSRPLKCLEPHFTLGIQNEIVYSACKKNSYEKGSG